MSAPSERDRLLSELAEAKLRMSDLTRELDESLGVETHDEMFVAKLQRVRECVLELQRALEALAS